MGRFVVSTLIAFSFFFCGCGRKNDEKIISISYSYSQNNRTIMCTMTSVMGEQPLQTITLFETLGEKEKELWKKDVLISRKKLDALTDALSDKPAFQNAMSDIKGTADTKKHHLILHTQMGKDLDMSVGVYMIPKGELDEDVKQWLRDAQIWEHLEKEGML